MWKKVDTHASARHGSIHVSEFGKGHVFHFS